MYRMSPNAIHVLLVCRRRPNCRMNMVRQMRKGALNIPLCHPSVSFSKSKSNPCRTNEYHQIYRIVFSQVQKKDVIAMSSMQIT